MALINCPECGKQVSDAARACPGCGYPVVEKLAASADSETGAAPAPADIDELTSKKLWHSAAYMPRTRELSDGKRKLLHRWCRLNS